MLNKTIVVYAIIEDISRRSRSLLEAIARKEDCQIQMTHGEIITTAIVAVMFFDGNHSKPYSYMKNYHLIPNMLEQSRFNRRL